RSRHHHRHCGARHGCRVWHCRSRYCALQRPQNSGGLAGSHPGKHGSSRRVSWGPCRYMSLLEVNAINTYYGDAHVLFDVSLRVEQHEVVVLLGRNGAGKSTTMKTIMGVMAPRGGSILFAGHAIEGQPPHKIARLGIQLVPEERRIIGGLT